MGQNRRSNQFLRVLFLIDGRNPLWENSECKKSSPYPKKTLFQQTITSGKPNLLAFSSYISPFWTITNAFWVHIQEWNYSKNRVDVRGSTNSRPFYVNSIFWIILFQNVYIGNVYIGMPSRKKRPLLISWWRVLT